jgi:hypothetical protein
MNMSLELAIKENTEAVTKLIATMEAAAAERKATLAKVESLAAEKPKGTRKAAEPVVETPASPPPPPPTEAASPPPPPPTAAASKSKVSLSDLTDTFSTYMHVADEAEREKRKAFVRSVLAEVGAKKVGEIPEENRDHAHQLLLNKIQADKGTVAPSDDDDLM